MKKENIAKVLENVDKEVLIEMLLKKLSNKSNSLKERREKIPLSAFTKELSILESVVKYLKENCKYKYSQIAKILNRDDRTIWTTYNNAKNKDKITVYDSDFDIPIKMFFKKKLSALESMSVFLKKEYDLGFTDIARLIDRNPKTIWTAYNRAKKK